MSRHRPGILGGGAVPFRRYRDASNRRDWVRRAGRQALADAEIEAARVDSLVVASESDFFSLQPTAVPGAVPHPAQAAAFVVIAGERADATKSASP